MRMLSVIAMVLSLTFTACSDPPNVGGTCTAPAKGCDDGLTCDTAVAGGYCTKTCATRGSSSECPEGSVCDDVAGLGTLECAHKCQIQSDCRSDLECNGTQGSASKICKVKA